MNRCIFPDFGHTWIHTYMAYIYRFFFFSDGGGKATAMCGFYLPCRWVSNAATFLTLVAHDQGLDREEGKEDRKERGKKRGGTTQISFNFLGGL